MSLCSLFSFPGHQVPMLCRGPSPRQRRYPHPNVTGLFLTLTTSIFVPKRNQSNVDLARLDNMQRAHDKTSLCDENGFPRSTINLVL